MRFYLGNNVYTGGFVLSQQFIRNFLRGGLSINGDEDDEIVIFRRNSSLDINRLL
jgi:hypothetical protein